MNPIDIVKNIATHVGHSGVIAGGCCRDIVLGRTPKDYDVFVYDQRDFSRLVEDKESFFDKPFKETQERLPTDCYGGKRVDIMNTTYEGELVQLIYPSYLFPADFLDVDLDRNPQSVIETFPFTINQMYYYVSKEEIRQSSEAEEALRRCQILFNADHRSAMRTDEIHRYLMVRMVYLADKLGYTIPQQAIDDIYDRHKIYHDEDVSDLLAAV